MNTCENCGKQITHTKGKYIITNGVTTLKLNVCSSACGSILAGKLY